MPMLVKHRPQNPSPSWMSPEVSKWLVNELQPTYTWLVHGYNLLINLLTIDPNFQQDIQVGACRLLYHFWIVLMACETTPELTC